MEENSQRWAVPLLVLPRVQKYIFVFLFFLAKCDYSLYLFQEVQFNFFPPDLSLVYFILR